MRSVQSAALSPSAVCVSLVLLCVSCAVSLPSFPFSLSLSLSVRCATRMLALSFCRLTFFFFFELY